VRWRLVLWAVVAALGLLALAIVGAGCWMVRSAARIERMPEAFRIPEPLRPARTAGRGVNFLVAGLDGENRTGIARGARSDAILVAHLDADRRKLWVVSIPRDTWVAIPGRHPNKVNAAYSLGGPSLFVETVETLTRLRMDHLVVVDWTGLRRLTDAVGGVPVDVLPPGANAWRDEVKAAAPEEPGVALQLSGDVALPYVSERKHLAAGDFDRMKRQQNFLRAFFRQALDGGFLTDPARLRTAAETVGDAVRVDSALTTGELLSLAASMRALRLHDITFLTAPSLGVSKRGAADVVLYDTSKGAEMWHALASDRMADFVAANGSLVTAGHVR
jgi:LCP family protein required for cell wall assembly